MSEVFRRLRRVLAARRRRRRALLTIRREFDKSGHPLDRLDDAEIEASLPPETFDDPASRLGAKASDFMIEILVRDHAEVDSLFGDLSLAFDSGDVREVFGKLDHLWARLAVHIRAEHLHLFPALLAAAERGGAGAGGAPTRGEVGAAVERLREDHDFFMRELAAAVNASRELASRAGTHAGEQLPEIRGRVRAVAERLVEHNRVEEEQVYGWSEVLLPGGQGDTLRAGMKRELENLPPRFNGGPRR